jgi:hypothetical protein
LQSRKCEALECDHHEAGAAECKPGQGAHQEERGASAEELLAGMATVVAVLGCVCFATVELSLSAGDLITSAIRQAMPTASSNAAE